MKRFRYLFLLLVSLVLTMQVDAQDWSTVIKKVASDRTVNDEFGFDVSISNNTAIIGAPFENRDSSGNLLAQVGAVYIFEKNSTGDWEEKQKLFASDQQAGDEFGTAVSIDNNTAIVRASRDSSSQHKFYLSYFFERDTAGKWIEVKKVRHDSISQFYTLPINEGLLIKNNIALIGTPYDENNGSVDIYTKDSTGTWTFFQNIVRTNTDTSATFGSSVAMSETSNTIIIGSQWEYEGITSNDSTHLAGAAYVFEKDSISKKWLQVQRLISQDRAEFDYFGSSIVNTDEYAIISSRNKRVDTMAFGQRGAIYFFQKGTNGTWNEVERKVGSSSNAAEFGGSLALDNNYLVVGSGGFNKTGPAYFYEYRNNNTWTLMKILNSPNSETNQTFGNSVAIAEGTALIADKNDILRSGSTNLPRAGAVYFVTTCTEIDTISRRACKSYQALSGKTYSSSGNYFDTIPTMSNCYYINFLRLTIDTIDVSVIDTVAGKLIAKADQVRYQWLDCDSNLAFIRGEYNKTLSPIKNGSYAVEIIKSGCIDTSACYSVTEVGIEENTFHFSVNLYPNPTSGKFTIAFDGKTASKLNASIYDINGRFLFSKDFKSENLLDLELNAIPGIYIIKLTDSYGKSATLRLLKQ